MAEKEYIDKETVLKHFDEVMNNEFCVSDFKKAALGFSICVSRLAAAVAPVRYGQWVDCNEEAAGCCSEAVHCSLCGEEAPISASDYYCRGGKIRYGIAPFCPNCGAKMDGGEGE